VSGGVGSQGYQGNSGTRGAEGATGSRGYQGYEGATGSRGYQGYQGYTGTPGAQGYQGVSGGQGPQGYQGYTGSPGSQGYQGVTGVGVQGYQGTSGIFAALTAGARVYRATDFAVTGSADIYIPFTNRRWDSGSIFTSGTNPTRLTANISGAYLIAGSVRFASGHKGMRQVFVRLNGTTEIDRISITSVSGTQTRLDVTTVYGLNATDYVELGVYQNETGSALLNVESNGNSSPEFMIQMLNGAGPQGFQGYQGYTGTQGAQGYQGTTGAGVQGYQGATGSQGTQGYQGSTGAGVQGYQGHQGATGSAGTPGSTVTGTPFYIPRFTANGTALENSNIYQTGTNIIITGVAYTFKDIIFKNYNNGLGWFSGTQSLGYMYSSITYSGLYVNAGLTIQGYLRVQSGLQVGSFSSTSIPAYTIIAQGGIYGDALVAGYSTGTPYPGELHVKNNGRIGGGLAIGSTLIDPIAGNLMVSKAAVIGSLSYGPSPYNLYIVSGSIYFGGATYGILPSGTATLHVQGSLTTNSLGVGSDIYSYNGNLLLKGDTAGVYFGSTNDVSLYRDGADVLGTADTIKLVQGNLRLASATINYIYFGSDSDVNLYRSSAGVLKTDDEFQAEGSIWTLGGDLNFYSPTGKLQWYDGVSSWDTNLYRSGANVLKTDDTLCLGPLAGGGRRAIYVDNSGNIVV
jgi:hypothetical protein